MADSGTLKDVYFIVLEEDGWEYLCCLHAFISRNRTANGYYQAYVLETESEEIIFLNFAEDLPNLRTQLDHIISLMGELVFCYRDEYAPIFDWYPIC